jgi:uncharacterized membrane protein
VLVSLKAAKISARDVNFLACSYIFTFIYSFIYVYIYMYIHRQIFRTNIKVKQSLYRPRRAQRVPGS